MESFRIVTELEYFGIRRSEMEIINQLKDKHSYLYDQYGDMIFDQNNQPVIDPSVIPTPEPITVSEKNRYAKIINGKNIMNTVDPRIIEGYSDVLAIDEQLLNIKYKGYNTFILGYFIDRVYQGSVWLYTKENTSLVPPPKEYLGVYGIRTSICNTLFGVTGVARKLLSYIQKEYSSYTIIVPWPLHPLPILLEKLGFKEYNIDLGENHSNPMYWPPEYEFSHPITSTTNYFVYEK